MFKKPNLDTLTKSRQKVYTSKLLTYLSNNGEQDASEYLNFLLNQKEEASTQKIDTTKLESIDAKILKVLEKIEENMIDEQNTTIKRKGRNGTSSGSSDSSNGLGNANGLGDEDEEGSGGGGPGLWLNRVRKTADKRRKDAEKKKKKEEQKKKKEEQKKKKEEEKKNKSKDTKNTKDTKPKTPKTPKTNPQKSWRIAKLLNLGENAVPSSGDQSTPKTQKKWRIGKIGKLINLGRNAFNASTLASAVPSFSSSTPSVQSTPKTEPKPVELKKSSEPVEPKKSSESVQKQENDIKKAKTETAENIKQEAKTVKASEGTKAPKTPKLGNGVKSGLKAVKGAGKALGAAGAILSAGVSVYEYATAESSAERMDAVGEGVGGFGGAMAGAALGATIGSIVPGVGTLIGGAVGGLIGGFLGSELGKGLMDWLKDPEDYVPDEVKDKGPEAILMYIDQVMYPQYIQGIESGDMDPDKLEELADYRNEVQSEVDEKNKKKEEAIKNYQEKISNPKKETSFLDKAKDIAVSAAKNSLIGKAVSFGLGLFSDDSEDSKDPKEEKAKETAKENIEAEASKGAEKESESIFSKVGKGLVKSIPVIGTAVTGLELASSALSATNLKNDVIDIDETLKLSAKEIKAIIDNKNLDDFTKKRLQEDYKLALQIDAFKNSHKDVEPSACVFLLKAKVKEAQTSLDALSENDAFSRVVLLDTIKMYNNLIEYYSNIKYDEKQFKVDFDKLTTDESVKKSSSLETFSGPSYSFLDAGVQGTSSQSGQPGQSVDLPPLDLKPSNAKFDENAELGILSKKYEAPGGVGTVSTGVGDPGGVSYGSWQLSTNAGTLGAYLKDTPDYAKFFGNAKPGTPEFTQRWKEIAKADPKGFEKSQHDFLYKKNFKGVLDYATSKGIDTSSKTIQNVLWSQAIQHGLKGNKTIINDALKNVDPKNNEEVIKAIYQSRSSYVNGLKMDGRTKASCIKRYKNEGSDALAMLANEKSGKPQVKTDDKTSTSSETNESTETKAQVSTSKGDTNASKTSSNNQQNTVTVKEQAALTAMQTVQNNINNNSSSNTNVNANEKEDDNKDHPKTAFIIKPLKGKFDF